ncbi:MAG: MarR family transcriptional regulator [Dehalococcoidales bacterium]|nr:MAG: MarR family transcriptional regulator [Dehalococcoidales bacterium]
MDKLREGGFLIAKIKQISGRIFNRKLKEHGINDINSAQGRIIFTLWQQDNMPIKVLSRNTALGITTLTSMLIRLEKAGYIIRTTDQNDNRQTLISLSKKVKSILENYENISKEMTALFYKDLTETQIDDFENTLRHILLNLVKYEEKIR